MGETDLQLGGGYTYQWECAILLALNYFFEPVRYNPTLDDLVSGFLGEVDEIHLEGRDQETGIELEDICLVRGLRRILIQVKAKQADWDRWTPTDPLLLKSLCRFYDSGLSATQPENTHFVFLTNRPFNRDLAQIRAAIDKGSVDRCAEADQLLIHLEGYTRKEKGATIDPARFQEMLARTALVEFLGVDEVKANVQAKLQAYGRADWQQAHAVLFEHFSRQATRVGGGLVTRESVGKLLGPGSRVETDAQVEARYRQQVARAYGHLTLRGYPERDPRLSAVPLERIFIKLSATTSRAPALDLLSSDRMWELEKLQEMRLGGKGRGRGGKGLVFEGRRLSETEADELLSRYEQEMEERRRPQTVILSVPEALRDHDRLVITGPPGSGKSTLLRWLALTFAEGKQALADRLGEAYPHDRLPLVVELRSFQGCFAGERERLTTVNLAEEIAAFVAEDARFEGTPAGFIRQALANGDCLVVFDGLDEIAELSARQRASSALQAFADNYAGRGNRVVVTCRTAGYRGAELGAGFQQCEINPFTPEDVSQFIHHWYEAVYPGDPAKANEDAARLVEEVQKSDRVARLAETPLLCTIIAIVYRRDSTLPTRRVDLYCKCCEALLDTWEQVKAIRQSGLIGGLDWQTKLELLSPLAYWLHSEQGRTAAPEAELEVRLAAELQRRRLGEEPKAEQEARAFLAAVRERSGLLQGRGDGTLEFPHLTFQEYLAARYIAAQPDPDYIDLVMPHLHEAWWREVHLLAIGHLGSGRDGAPKASRLLEAILDRYRPPARLLRAIPYPGSRLRRSFLSLVELMGSASEWLKTLPASALPRWQMVRRLAWAMQRELFFAAAALDDCASLGVTNEVRDRIGTALGEVLLLAMADACWIGPDTPWLTAAARSLVQLGQASPKVVAGLVRTLGNDYIEVREVAARSLGQLGQATPQVVAALVHALGDRWSAVRDAAASSLAQLSQASPKAVAALVSALGHSDRDVRHAAASSLGELGQATPEVVAALVHALGDSDWGVRARAAGSLGQLRQASLEVAAALAGALGDSDWFVRMTVAGSLERLGQATPEVVAALVGALENSDWRIWVGAARSLGRMGWVPPEVVATLAGTLKDNDLEVRKAAASSLGELGQATPEVIAALAGTLKDSDPKVRKAATSSLGELGQATPEVVAALAGALRDSDSGVRWEAAGSLGELGQATPEVVATLAGALRDSDWGVRQAAAHSLGQMGQAMPEVIAALAGALRDSHSGVRREVARSLGRLGQATPEVVATLAGALGDSDLGVRWEAASSLGELGQATPEVGAALADALRNSDSDVRQAAAHSLGQMGQAMPEVIAALASALRDSHSGVRREAASSLGQLRQASPEVVAVLTGALKDRDRGVRDVAASSLVQLGQATPEVVAALVNAVRDSDSGVRWEAAASSLDQLRQATPEVVAVLAGALKDSNWLVRGVAANSLVQMGQAMPEAVAVLAGTLKDSDRDARREGASSLGRLTQATPKVVAVLAGALKDSDPEVREAAVSSLGELGQATPEVVAALVGALTDSDSSIRKTAANSLGQLGQATLEVVAALNRNLHDSYGSARIAAHEALSKLLNGMPLPGDEWVPLRERPARSKRKLRHVLLVLLALAVALAVVGYGVTRLYQA